MSSQSNNILKNQKITFAIFLIGLGILLITACYYVLQDDFKESQQQKNLSDLPMDKVNPQEIWMTRIEGENQIIEQKLGYLEQLIIDSKRKEESTERENRDLKKEISNLRKEIKTFSEKPVLKERQEEIAMNTSYGEPFFNPSISSCPQSAIRQPLAELVAEDCFDKVQHVDKVIPAGTSVKALLVSSLDAPCGVYSCSDPQPVKLRLLDNGHLPKCVQARLKGGIIIASAYGDISSERVYMRMERLTQVKADGNFVETAVTGFVTGEDGKYGVRGVVVDKSTKLVENAALSGFFSGISEYLQTAATSRYCVSYENNCGPQGCYPNACNMATQSGIGGACGAFDMLTDYYIKRAEQIRPIIQVTAGRIVDVTFTHSAELGDLYTKDRVKEIRDKSRGEG